MWGIVAGIFIISYLLFMVFWGPLIALYASLTLILILHRIYSFLTMTSNRLDEIYEQVDLSNINKPLIIPPEGTSLENNFCIVKIMLKNSTCCYIVEKQLPNIDSYRSMEIKASYKTGDFLGAVFDVFAPETNYDSLKTLCNLFEIDYKEKSVRTKPNIINKQGEIVLEEEPVPKVEPAMPVLQVDIDEPKKDKEPEIKYNDEREVDL